jgi:ElaB/YqjD/DUF883 family membrane-anchored ribosome-binding protein
MPIIEESHVQSHAEKQAASVICSEYDDVRDAAQQVEDAKVDALFTRFQWGRAIYNAIKRDGVDTGDVYAEVAKRLDKSESYVSHHKRFAERCAEVYPGYEPPVAGYVAEAQDKDWRLSWNRAVSWISEDSSEEDQQRDPDKEIDRLIKDIEHLWGEMDEKLTTLEEKAQDGEVPEALRKEAESVHAAAQEDIQDTIRRLAQLEDAAPRRVEDELYREWFVRQGACWSCGVQDDTLVGHHLREYISETGIATKPHDYYLARLCHDCHQRCEDMPSLEFWQHAPVDDPKSKAEEIATKFLILHRSDQL